nr:chemotaxis protein [Escherichia coli]
MQRLNQADHLSSRVAVFTLEEHEVARHESRSYKLRQWYPEVIEKAL